MPLALHPGPLCQLRRDPPAQVCAPYHVLPLQVPEGGRGAAPGTACGADNVHLQDRGSARHELLRSEQLIAKKRRNKLAAADKTICYLTRGTFKEDQHDTGFTDTRWVELEELYENCGKTPLKNALKKYRKAEEEDVDAAIADFEEGVEHEG